MAVEAVLNSMVDEDCLWTRCLSLRWTHRKNSAGADERHFRLLLEEQRPTEAAAEVDSPLSRDYILRCRWRAAAASDEGITALVRAARYAPSLRADDDGREGRYGERQGGELGGTCAVD